MTWGSAWGSSAWGGDDALPIYSSVHLGNILVNGHAGGFGKLTITQSVASKAGESGKVALSQSVASKSAATATITMSSSVKSTATGISKLSFGKVSVKSTAPSNSTIYTSTSAHGLGAGSASIKHSALSIKASSSGVGSISQSIGVRSTASPFVTGGRIRLGAISVSSKVAGYGAIAIKSPVAYGRHGGSGVAVLPQAVIMSGVLIERVAYAMNTKTAQLTQYTNFDFLAIIRLGNNHYGVKPTGLYKFTGTTDNGTAIDARLTTHETDYGTNKLKNVAHVYLDSEDPSYTMAIVDGIEKTEQSSSFGGRKTKLARGTLGRWWQYRIRNKDAKLRVAGIEVLVEERDRRIN